ncbi:MAG TPA: transglycosylase family protein, partial [Solirubrobacteraceae bacterium]|nr:transglycosylase family protein [Solirubrobacteraceae bacterium]
LAAELVNQYEQPQESFVSIVINSSGFSQMLSQLEYLDSAKKQEQAIINLTRFERNQALAASARIAGLVASDQRAADDASTQADALEGMNSLLSSRQNALADERAAQATALQASQARGSQLRSAITQIQAQEAAAERAAEQIAADQQAAANAGTGGGSSGGATAAPVTGGGSIGGSGGWAIPEAIVLCESGGQNLPPNSAGASGYYQIIPSTWHDFGGTGPAAYLASKSEQDAVAAKIWNGGAGASNWSCSAMVGIT